MTHDPETLQKIHALTRAKLSLEQSMEILALEGYTTANNLYRNLYLSKRSLEFDINGLETGALPLIVVNR